MTRCLRRITNLPHIDLPQSFNIPFFRALPEHGIYRRTGVPVVCEDKSGVAVGIPPASFGLIPYPANLNWTTQSFTFAPENLYGTYARREITGYPQSMWEVQDYLPQGTFCRRIFGAYLAFKATGMPAQ